MPLDLYHTPGSGPCRAVRLAAAALGVNINLKLLDLGKGEHKQPEYLKLNPQHTVPTLVDNGFCLWESRAIMTYLANQHAKIGRSSCLYPKEPQARASVEAKLYFDIGTLNAAFQNYYYPIIFAKAKGDEAAFEKIEVAFEFLETFLKNKEYVAGDHMTLADLSLIVTVSNFEVMEYSLEKFPNVQKWALKIKSEAANYEEINGEGAKAFKAFVEIMKNH